MTYNEATYRTTTIKFSNMTYNEANIELLLNSQI